MFNVGTGEFLLILVLALIVLGPDKLPTAARQAGKYLAEFRRMSSGFQQEFRNAVDSAMADPPRRSWTDELDELELDLERSGSGSYRPPAVLSRETLSDRLPGSAQATPMK